MRTNPIKNADTDVAELKETRLKQPSGYPQTSKAPKNSKWNAVREEVEAVDAFNDTLNSIEKQKEFIEENDDNFFRDVAAQGLPQPPKPPRKP